MNKNPWNYMIHIGHLLKKSLFYQHIVKALKRGRLLLLFFLPLLINENKVLCLDKKDNCPHGLLHS